MGRKEAIDGGPEFMTGSVSEMGHVRIFRVVSERDRGLKQEGADFLAPDFEEGPENSLSGYRGNADDGPGPASPEEIRKDGFDAVISLMGEKQGHFRPGFQEPLEIILAFLTKDRFRNSRPVSLL